MSQEYPHSVWYDQSLPAAPASPAPKKHTGMKVTMIVVFVLLLIVASVYAFADRRIFPAVDVEWEWETPNRSGSGGTPDGAPDDFRAFFDEYYRAWSVDDKTSASKMERVAGDPGLTLRLVSARDREELSLQELYRTRVDSIVGIRAYYDDSEGYGWGCCIVMTEDGYLVTNQHIVADAVSATVILPDGSEHEALLIGEDRETDLAVLKIDAGGLSPAEFGDSGELVVGDRVAAIGNPLGDSLSGTMTDGIVSAINRDIDMDGRSMTLLQTNTAINEGSSGGALFNMYGQVVGVTFMKFSNKYSDVTIEGLSFAIPSSTVKTVTDALIARGEVTGRPRLGITLGSIPAEAEEQYELPEGLYVVSIEKNSDAAGKNIRVGDIVTHVNGQPVSSIGDVLAVRDTLSVGSSMVLTLWRDGESFDVTVILREQNEFY